MNALAARPPRPGGGAADTKQYRTHFRRGPFAIHQILAGATPGDAITTAALEYRDVLRRVGPSEVFARHIAPGAAGEVKPLSECGADGSSGLLVYHASIGEPAVSAFLLSRTEPIVLVYHNITPSKYFEGLDSRFAELLMLGRVELEQLRPRVVMPIAASRFNAAELEAIGYRDVRVIPPVVEPVPARAHTSRRGNAQLSRPGVSTSRSSCSSGSCSRTNGPTCS